jgi:hypothetical protein
MVMRHPLGKRTATAVFITSIVTMILGMASAQQVPQWEYGILSVEEFFGEQGEDAVLTSTYTWTASGVSRTGNTLASLLAELTGSEGTEIDLYNHLGQQGWELVTIHSRPPRPILSSTSEIPQGMLITDVQWIFKRPSEPDQ